MSAPTYKITTVLDFLKVPEDRREVCLKEFLAWLALVESMGEVFKGLPVKSPKSFDWIDDDLHTITGQVVAGDKILASVTGKVRGFE